MSITTSQIIEEYGAFYIDAGQNKKRILQMLSQPREITAFATPIKTDDTIFRLANAAFRSLVQPFKRPLPKKGVWILSPMRFVNTGLRLTMSLCPMNWYLPGLGF